MPFDLIPDQFSEFAENFKVSEYDPTNPWIIPLNSSCLSQVEYNPITENLTVQFTDGTVGEYHLVSYSEFWGLVTSPSVGKYFNYYIRNSHTWIQTL